MSGISAELRDAYLATHYRVHAQHGTITLRIDHPAPALKELHHAHGVSCSAFLTAWNPFSQAATPQANHQAQQALVEDLRRQNIFVLPGVGVDPGSNCPGEDSVLALGPSREEACRLGQRYGQNAIVWCGADVIPELVLLR